MKKIKYIIYLQKKKIRLYIILSYFLLILHLILIQYGDFKFFFLGDHDIVSITEVVFETKMGNFFSSHHFGNMDTENFLSHHFSPGLAVLVIPLYLFSQKMTIPYTYTFFVLLGLIFYERIIYKFLKKRSEYLIFSLIPITNNYFYQLFISYHFEILFFAYFSILIFGLYTRYTLIECIGFLLCITIKEDISLYLSIFYFLFLVKKPGLKNFLFLIFSIIYFLTIPIVQENLDPSSHVNWLDSWNIYGDSKIDIILYFITHPLIPVYVFLEKISIFFRLVSGVTFFSLIPRPESFTFFLLFILQASSTRVWYNNFYHYYGYTVLPFLLFGAIFSLKNFDFRIKNKLIEYHFFIFIIGSFIISNYSADEHPKNFSLQKENKKYEIVSDVVSKIPDNAKVSTQFYLGMHLRGNHKVYPLRKERFQEFILLDTSGYSPYTSIEELLDVINIKVAEKKILLYYTNDTVKLYRKID